ncbi:MAG: formate--tetrahydrofolate ligase, partial [Nocardioides sp.]
CNSVVATRTALKLADYVVTEAGFGADLGAEKFVDIKCRMSGLRPSAVVVVATVRALKYHGGVALADLAGEDLDALEAGTDNLRRHLHNIRDVYGLPAVVAINRFPSDTDAEVELLVSLVDKEGATAFPATHFSDGGAGAETLAAGVLDAIEAEATKANATGDSAGFSFVYDDAMSLAEKAHAVATKVYGAAAVSFDGKARRRLDRIEAEGYGHLPVCLAKTQYSFSTDPAALGAPSGHVVNVREVRLAAGAGFVVLVTGDVMTMPGLPKEPASHHIDIDDSGAIVGLS